MSLRANSLRNLLLDSFSFTFLVGLAAIAWAAIAQGAEPQVVHVADAAADNRPSRDHIDSRLNTDDKRTTGIPTESPAAKREAMMLGMKLFERAEGDIAVVDVAATSPAWDAGIRRGDLIRSIDGIKPKSLAPWVDDVGKVLKNTEDGHGITAKVERDGEPLALRIKVPVSKAAEVRDARQEEQAIARMRAGQPGQIPQGQPGGVPVGYDTGDRTAYGPAYGGYGGWGLGGFFGDDGDAPSGNGDDRMASSAIAPLMAVDPAAFGGNEISGGQIGVAGFQDNGQGVDAMVSVRGLPQGTYQVGIGAGGDFGGDANPDFVGPDIGADGQFGLSPALEGTADSFDRAGVNSNRAGASNNQGGPNRNQTNSQNGAGNQQPNQQLPNQQIPNQQQPGVVPQGGHAPIAPQGGGPAGGAAGGGGGAAPTGAGASLANPRNSVLAQQLDSKQLAQVTADQPANAAQPTGRQGAQNNVGAANNAAAARQNASGPGANPFDPRDRAEAQRRMQNGNNPLGNGFAPGFASIGTLTVGANGTGQVQNRLEGMSVRNLAGMQVFVQSTNFQTGTGGGAATNPQGARAQNRVAQRQARAGQGGQQPGFAFPGEIPTRGTQGIVAVGTIQLRNGGNNAAVNPQTSQQPLDEATRREQGRSQISNPTQQLNPSR